MHLSTLYKNISVKKFCLLSVTDYFHLYLKSLWLRVAVNFFSSNGFASAVFNVKNAMWLNSGAILSGCIGDTVPSK